jgi:serine/threonine protein kinase
MASFFFKKLDEWGVSGTENILLRKAAMLLHGGFTDYFELSGHCTGLPVPQNRKAVYQEDLITSNILIKSKGQVKLGDFGLADAL